MTKPTMVWQLDVRTKEYYNELVATGLAWELYKDLPLTWEECLEELEENGDV